jgi:hypothetical protein
MDDRIQDNYTYNYTEEYAGKHGMCRTCEHAHWERLICSVRLYKYGITGSLTKPFVYRCGCERWAPKDNLEYLEYKSSLKEEQR